MKNPKPILIYIILLFSMLTLLVTIDVLVGTPLSIVLHRTIFSFFRYVDRVEYFLVIALLIYPIIIFIWKTLVKKKQQNV